MLTHWLLSDVAIAVNYCQWSLDSEPQNCCCCALWSSCNENSCSCCHFCSCCALIIAECIVVIFRNRRYCHSDYSIHNTPAGIVPGALQWRYLHKQKHSETNKRSIRQKWRATYDGPYWCNSGVLGISRSAGAKLVVMLVVAVDNSLPRNVHFAVLLQQIFLQGSDRSRMK